uniref:Stum, mechanosensory transduction mediator homolog n=1 Tax=Bubo bubo TaxID=30461 RepID=A0A8C0FVC0_BUBBB
MWVCLHLSSCKVFPAFQHCSRSTRKGIWHKTVAFTGCFVVALSLGTFVSAFTVLCGARTDLPDRHMCCVFWLNIAAALIQILTAIVMVGWIMSIFWGMDMVILANSSGWLGQAVPEASASPRERLTLSFCFLV